MKISLEWLKEHLPSLDLGSDALAQALLNLGFEVSAIERRGAAFSGVVAGKIISVGKHPNADRLSLCAVESGGETFSVVCGAKNIAPGQTVPLAKPGAKLPGGRILVKTVIRGVESHGMLCSVAELGLGADHNGILILEPNTPSGRDLSSVLAKSDTVFEVEITPNRPDCLSHLGLARELSAALSLPLSTREAPPTLQGSGSVKAQIEDARACPLYTATLFSSLEIGPSPGWLCAKLESVGLRSINNLVDVTNYILMDVGQPLHAFDYDKLAGSQIIVRFAKNNETIAALDDKTYRLTPECLVVADAQKPAAVAGVMGGTESAIGAKTKQVLLESAYFSPAAVRRTSQILRLRSDSSYRFERGTDPSAPRAAAAMAAKLIRELCGKSVQMDARGLAGSEPAQAEPISVSSARINEILGSNFTPQEISKTLKPLSAQPWPSASDISFYPPTYRHDLATEWDLAEEAARLLGYERIPAKSPISRPALRQTDPKHAAIIHGRARLAAAGLLEACNQDFVSEKTLQMARQISTKAWARPANPLSEEVAVLRPSLLPGLLQNAALNFSRGARTVRLFEIGKVYRTETTGAIAENWRVAGILSGPVSEIFWQSETNAEYDFYHVKGIVENLLPDSAKALFRADSEAGFSQNPGWADLVRLFHPGIRADIAAQNKPLFGLAGYMHPAAATAWDFGQRTVCLFEIDAEALVGLSSLLPNFAPYSQFPGSWRDISIILAEQSSYDQVEKTIRAAGGDILKDVRLTDRFSGKNVEPGKISMTLRLFFGRDERTLADTEVAAAIETVLKALEKNLDARLRGK